MSFYHHIRVLIHHSIRNSCSKIKCKEKVFGVYMYFTLHCGRRSGLMVSALDSGSSSPGTSPGQGHCVVFLFLTLTVPLSTLVYKWVPANLMLGVTLRWTSHPWGIAIFLKLINVTETGINSSLMGHLGSYADFTFTLHVLYFALSAFQD